MEGAEWVCEYFAAHRSENSLKTLLFLVEPAMPSAVPVVNKAKHNEPVIFVAGETTRDSAPLP